MKNIYKIKINKISSATILRSTLRDKRNTEAGSAAVSANRAIYGMPVIAFLQILCLTLTTLWAFSADDKFTFFLLFSQHRILYFLQTVSNGGDLYEISDPVLGEI